MTPDLEIIGSASDLNTMLDAQLKLGQLQADELHEISPL